MKQIAPNLYTFTHLKVGRVYLVVDPDGLTVIDTSLPEATQRILKQLGEIGRQPADVKRILITHAHPDHIGGLPELARLTGAEVWASEGEARVIRGEAPITRPERSSVPWPAKLMTFMPPPPPEENPAPVHRTLSDGETLTEVMSEAGGLQVVSTPGHTLDHISFWQPEQRILFTGDTMIHFPWGLGKPIRAFTVDMRRNMRSARKLAQLEPRTLLFGHGTAVTEDAARKLHKYVRTEKGK